MIYRTSTRFSNFRSSKQLYKVPAFTSRIQGLIEDQDPEAGGFCAYRLAAIASELFDATAFDEAAIFVQAAQRLDPHDEKLFAFANDIQKAMRLDSETTRLQADESVLRLVRGMAQFFTDRYFGRIEDEDAEEISYKLTEAARVWSVNDLRIAVAKVRNYYPTVYAHTQNAYDTLHELGIAAPAPSSSSGGGCMVLAVFVLLTLASLLVR